MRRACAAEPVYTRLGSIFHDLPYYGNMLAEAVRYGLGSPALDEPWAYRMHSVRPDRFVASYIRAAATAPGLERDERLALVGGLVSHAALDLTLHPLVNYCARRDTAEHGGHESVHHRLTEKYQALFFHLDRIGHDPIGTAEFRQLHADREVRLADARPRRGADRAVHARRVSRRLRRRARRRHLGRLGAQLPPLRHARVAADRQAQLRQEGARPGAAPALLRERRLPLLGLLRALGAARGRARQPRPTTTSTPAISRAASEDAFVRAARIDDLAEPGLVYPELLAQLPELPRLSVYCTPGITAPPGNEPWRKRDRRRDLRRERKAAARVRRHSANPEAR